MLWPHFLHLSWLVIMLRDAVITLVRSIVSQEDPKHDANSQAHHSDNDAQAKAEATTRAMIQSEAGKVLPPELFLGILLAVAGDDRSAEVDERMRRTHPRDPDLRSLEVLKAKPSYTLKSCTLVCRYWAQQCRAFIFKDAQIRITSYKQARQFMQFTMKSSGDLDPIAQYIAQLHVEQFYSRTVPFFQLVNLPRTQMKLGDLFISGPFPSHVPIGSRDTPHWNAPYPFASKITPANTAYKSVTVARLDFPSLRHAVKYMRHFGDAEDIRLRGITWTAISGHPPAFIQSMRQPNRRKGVTVQASDCTDDLLVCLYVAMMFGRFPLRREVPADDQLWAINLFTIVRDFYYQHIPVEKGQKPKCNLYSSGNLDLVDWSRRSPPLWFWLTGFSAKYPSVSIYFECGPRRPLAGRHSFGPIRIIGVTLVIHTAKQTSKETAASTFDLTALKIELEDRCALSFVVIAFEDLSTMHGVLKHHPTLRDSFKNRRTYLFAVRESRNNGPFYDWVAVNPVTLDHTGERWSHERRILPSIVVSR